MKGRIFVLGLVAMVAASSPAAEPAVVSHIKVVSDKVADVSSLDAWKASVIKQGMTDEQKAMAVWNSVVAFRHQETPPNEYLENEGHPHDPIKAFNVYGYGQCCCASANLMALARHAGLTARGWGITQHSVPEVQWAGQWHMLDASLVTYFPKADGSIAGVEEISASIKDWYDKNPSMKGNDKALREFMRGGGWKKGPELLKNCPSYDNNGWLPAATHGWYATVQEYGNPSKNFVYEYGTAVGYQVNVQLRKGEKLTRNWSNKGLHVNQLEGGKLPTLNKTPGKEDLRYSPKYGDLAPGRVGNGELVWNVPVTSPELEQAAEQWTNLKADKDGLRIDESGKGVLVLRVPSSYIFLTGQMEIDGRGGYNGGINIEFSDNNGLDWKGVAIQTDMWKGEIDLDELVYRRYDYLLRFTFTGPRSCIEKLVLSHIVQHSQRALPALDKGANTITFSAGPQEGTVTVQGNINPAAAKEKNVTFAAFHPVLNNIKPGGLWLAGGKGDITLPVTTPGDITRLRLGVHYRARDQRDGFDVSASFDNGQSWKPVGKLEGPTGIGFSKYLVLGDVPKGSRAALVRFEGKQVNTTGLLDLRIDADYTQPHGGFAPIKVTYDWEENGQPKQHIHIARQPTETYTITCAEKPLLKSLIIERTD